MFVALLLLAGPPSAVPALRKQLLLLAGPPSAVPALRKQLLVTGKWLSEFIWRRSSLDGHITAAAAGFDHPPLPVFRPT
jgi:hypothetical protein